MSESRKNADEQATLWNGVAGQSWVAAQEVLDGMFRPFERLLLETALTRSRASVLDVGCGTGGTTIALAQALGPASRCVGVDISRPMLEHARTRAERDGTAV